MILTVFQRDDGLWWSELRLGERFVAFLRETEAKAYAAAAIAVEPSFRRGATRPILLGTT